MKAILRRELKSYFASPIGYVCIAVLLFLSGLLYWNVMSIGSSSYIAMVYSNLFTFSMMVIPILTMKSMSDEQKNKTDQALLTAPVSVTAIVLGKFLAAFIVYAIAMTGSLLPCVAISLFGSQLGRDLRLLSGQPVLWRCHDRHRRVYFQPDCQPGDFRYCHLCCVHLHSADGSACQPGQRYVCGYCGGVAVL